MGKMWKLIKLLKYGNHSRFDRSRFTKKLSKDSIKVFPVGMIVIDMTVFVNKGCFSTWEAWLADTACFLSQDPMIIDLKVFKGRFSKYIVKTRTVKTVETTYK